MIQSIHLNPHSPNYGSFLDIKSPTNYVVVGGGWLSLGQHNVRCCEELQIRKQILIIIYHAEQITNKATTKPPTPW